MDTIGDVYAAGPAAADALRPLLLGDLSKKT